MRTLLILLTAGLLTGSLSHAAEPDQAASLLETLDPFYTQHVVADGLLIVSSEKVSEYALREAAYLVRQMLAHRPDVLQKLVERKMYVCVMAYNEMQTDLPECRLDADRVKQIMLNLLNNAADELPQGGSIRVSTSLLHARGIALDIADSGPGIPPHKRETLFDQAHSGKPSGFGLGLRVTRELVELHGGAIEVADSELGGVLVRVIFPVEI